MRLAAVLIGLVLLGNGASAQPTKPGPQPVAVGDLHWTAGYWKSWQDTLARESLPAMSAVMEGNDHQFLANFRIASGRQVGTHKGPPWNDGDCYKWLEALCSLYAVDRDPARKKQIDAAVAAIAAAQAPDGYLHTPVLIKRRNGEDAKPFRDRQNFEMYNFGHLFTAACIHHRATGEDSLLHVARAAADQLCAVFARPTPDMASNNICPSHYMGLIELHRETGDKKYLDLVRRLVEMRDAAAEGTDDNQDRIPFRQQRQAVGHAVRANYLYAGMADYAVESGDQSLLEPLKAIWNNVVSRKMYVTGACGALYDGASPDGTKEQKTISRVHQAYGRDFQLPNSTAYNESCAAVGNILWNARMFRLTGEAKYADVVETAMHNALPACIGLDGKTYFYTNALRQLDDGPHELRWSRSREAWISCYCCPPNVVRTIAQAGTYAYSVSPSAVWANLYGACELNAFVPDCGRVKLIQKTDYPWNGRIALEVAEAPSNPFALKLRIPGWCEGATFRINGGETQPAARGNYAGIERVWKAGDRVELDLPMPVRLLEANPQVEENRGQVAVARGPVVYCLESKDLPADVRLLRVKVPAESRLYEVNETKDGTPATLLVKAGVREEPNWGTELYREHRPAPDRTIDIRLIPYHTWGNRGKSEMSVWLPLR